VRIRRGDLLVAGVRCQYSVEQRSE
jgi:hypothetical protein